MDNAETWLGLVANQKLAALAGDSARAKLDAYLATRTMYALAADRVGEPQTAKHFIQEYVSVEGKNNPQALASTAGELALALNYGWNNTLWF